MAAIQRIGNPLEPSFVAGLVQDIIGTQVSFLIALWLPD